VCCGIVCTKTSHHFDKAWVAVHIWQEECTTTDPFCGKKDTLLLRVEVFVSMLGAVSLLGLGELLVE